MTPDAIGIIAELHNIGKIIALSLGAIGLGVLFIFIRLMYSRGLD